MPRRSRAVAVNLRAPYLLARWVLLGCSSAATAASSSPVRGRADRRLGRAALCPSKALHVVTHFLASRVAANGVTVNAIAPALIEDTGMPPGDPGELAKAVPVGRLERRARWPTSR